MNIHRRDLLKSGLAGLAGLTFGRSPLAGAMSAKILPTPNGRRIILLPMRGGFDGLHMVPPVDPQFAAFHARRPNIAITSNALPLNDGTGLAFHPRMTRLKAMWDSSDCALLHQVGWPGASGSHFISQDRNAAARADTTLHDSGWMIRAAENFNMTTTEAIATGVGSVLDVRQTPMSAYRPLSVSNVDTFVLPQNANDPLDPTSIARNTAGIDAEGAVVPSPGSVVEQFHIANQSAFQLIDDVAAGVTNYDSLVNGGAADYSTSGFARNLKDMARLISVSGGAPAAYAVPLLGLTFTGGFDTHGAQVSRLNSLLEDVDINLNAFVKDLKAMGLFDDTVIVMYSEFGRRVAENGNQGTDHGEGNNAFVIGGCVNGKNHFGNISTATELQNEFNVPVSMDFRHLFETLLGSWLGTSASNVLQIIDDPSDAALRPDLSTLFSC